MNAALAPFIVLAAAEAIAMAVWLIPASVHIVEWAADGPTRLALLAPATRFAGLAVGGAATGALVYLWARRDRNRLAVAAAIGAPVCLFWLWVVPYVPWIADTLPLLLVLSGPLRWVVAAIAAVGAARAGGWLPAWRPRRVSAPGRRAVFVLSLALFLVFGLMQARAFGPGGDEPHYLIIIDSLLEDGDLRIANNHERGDYRAYFRGGELRPDYLARGTNGEIYSVHAAGLPVLLAPAYAAAGYLGAVALLALIGALAALAVFDIGETIGGRGIAWLTWLAVCLSAPFVPYAWLLFPEMPGALLVAWATLWSLGPTERSTRTWVLRGLALATLPWLHTKFVILLAVFGTALFLRLWRRPALAAAFASPIAISGILWLASFYVVYGTLDPQAPYGAWAATNVMNRNIPRGLLGLTFDQKFGLLFYSPIYLAAIAGCWLMIRGPQLRVLGVVLLLTVAAHVGSTTRLYMWWGGSSAPARFLVPILPCLGAMIAVAARAASSRASRALLGVWVTIGLSAGLVGAAWPERLFLFSEPHGRGRLVETLQAGSPLSEVYPTFTTQDWQTPLHTLGPWLLVAGLSLAAMFLVSRRWPRRSSFWLGCFGSLTFLLVASITTARPAASAREEAARRGALDVLSRFDGSLRGLDYERFSRLTHAEILERAVVVDRRSPAGPYTLPPGAYEARVWFTGGLAREGTVTVSSSGAAIFGRVSGRLQNPTLVPFDLPVPASRVVVSAGGSGPASTVTQTDLVARAIVPQSERLQTPTRGIESVAGEPGRYIVYMDRAAYPEGGVYWTRGTEASTVLVAPGNGSRISLTLHLGPKAGDVVVTALGEEHRVPVTANATTRFELAVPEGLRLVPITVQSPTMFVPAEVSETDDTRQLGCQVRVEVR